MPHPQGTCVLLEVNTLNELINYFQGRYQNPNVLFELKGVHINEEQCDMTHFWSTVVSCPPRSKSCRCWNYNHSYSLLSTSFCSICFSMIKYCGYWNSQTLDRITNHANKCYKEKLMVITIHWLLTISQRLQMYDASISSAFNLEKQGKLLLQKLITDNTRDNTGFLMWISNYCFSCIFQHNK